MYQHILPISFFTSVRFISATGKKKEKTMLRENVEEYKNPYSLVLQNFQLLHFFPKKTDNYKKNSQFKKTILGLTSPK